MSKFMTGATLILINLGVVALVAFAFSVNHSLWSFCGLVFMFASRPVKIETKCPKCDHLFTAVKREED